MIRNTIFHNKCDIYHSHFINHLLITYNYIVHDIERDNTSNLH